MFLYFSCFTSNPQAINTAVIVSIQQNYSFWQSCTSLHQLRVLLLYLITPNISTQPNHMWQNTFLDVNCSVPGRICVSALTNPPALGADAWEIKMSLSILPSGHFWEVESPVLCISEKTALLRTQMWCLIWMFSHVDERNHSSCNAERAD